jgi:hypothetical protein
MATWPGRTPRASAGVGLQKCPQMGIFVVWSGSGFGAWKLSPPEATGEQPIFRSTMRFVGPGDGTPDGNATLQPGEAGRNRIKREVEVSGPSTGCG